MAVYSPIDRNSRGGSMNSLVLLSGDGAFAPIWVNYPAPEV
jgi:hypothetical protein